MISYIRPRASAMLRRFAPTAKPRWLLKSTGGFEMHELGIAQGILEIVQQYVPSDQAAGIQWVRVRVGQMAGVVADSLDFSFQAIVADTPWQAARLAIDKVPAVADCSRCGRRFDIEDTAFLCPACGSNDIRMISGTELQVVEIEMADAQDEAL